MIALDSLENIGRDLARPECVLCTSNGRLYAANIGGGITIIEADGSQWDLVATDAGAGLYPNGICLMPDGSFLLAHLGAETGGVFRLYPNGDLEPFLTKVDGVALPPTNYVHRDDLGRIWVTVSTRLVPREFACRPDVSDGFVVLVDENGARVVADNLGYTNECLVHPDGRRLFVNETFGRRLTAFDIDDDGDLSNRTVVAEFGPGTFPDGLAFGADGDIWITSIVSNRVIRVSPDGGEQRIMMEDNDPDHLAWVEEAFQAGELGRTHLDTIRTSRLKNISSLAFGGADLRRFYLGCLLDDHIYACEAPVAGHPPSHWHFSGPEKAAG